MLDKFHAPHPWKEIQKHAGKQKSIVAVPFMGKDAAKMLPIPAGSILVTRFTPTSVKAGQVSPLEIIKLLKRGVKIHSYADLHAKVYVFGNRTFVGSANVSNSSQRLAEACIETTNSKLVAQAKAFIQELTGDLVTLEQAKKMVSLYPKDGERMYGFNSPSPKKRKHIAQPRSNVWLYSLINTGDWPEEANSELDKVKPSIEKKIKRPKETQLREVLWQRKPLFAVGDWAIWRWKTPRGFDFECPSKIIAIHAIPKTNKFLVFYDQPIDCAELTLAKLKPKMKGIATEAELVKGGLVRNPDVAIKLLRAWPHHQANL